MNLEPVPGRHPSRVRRAPDTHQRRDVRDREADDHRERRDDLEVRDRAERERADALHVVAMPRNSDHEGREDEGREQQLDHAQEQRRQYLQVGRVKRPCVRPIGKAVADDDARYHRDEDPMGLRQAQPLGLPRRGGCRLLLFDGHDSPEVRCVVVTQNTPRCQLVQSAPRASCSREFATPRVVRSPTRPAAQEMPTHTRGISNERCCLSHDRT